MVGAESAAPQVLSQHNVPNATDRYRFSKGSAGECVHTQNLKEVGRHGGDHDPLRLVTRKCPPAKVVSRQIGKARGRAPVEKVRRSHPPHIIARLGLPDGDELRGVREWKGLQQHGMHDAEDERIRADPERQRQRDGKCESRPMGELTEGVPEIVHSA